MPPLRSNTVWHAIQHRMIPPGARFLQRGLGEGFRGHPAPDAGRDAGPNLGTPQRRHGLRRLLTRWQRGQQPCRDRGDLGDSGREGRHRPKVGRVTPLTLRTVPPRPRSPRRSRPFHTCAVGGYPAHSSQVQATPSDDVLLIETTDRVRTLTLNRPQSRNALSSALQKRFFAALREADADEAVDVSPARRRPGVLCRTRPQGARVHHRLARHLAEWPPMTKPVIGAITVMWSLAGSNAPHRHPHRSSEQARFARHPRDSGRCCRRGGCPGAAAAEGRAHGPRTELSSAQPPPRTAPRAVLVTEVVAHDQLMPTARRTAAAIVGNNQKAVRALLASYHRTTTTPRPAKGSGRGDVRAAMDEQRERRLHRREPLRGDPEAAEAGRLRLGCRDLVHQMCGSQPMRKAMREAHPAAGHAPPRRRRALGRLNGATTDVLSQAAPRSHSRLMTPAATLTTDSPHVPSSKSPTATRRPLPDTDNRFSGAACSRTEHTGRDQAPKKKKIPERRRRCG